MAKVKLSDIAAIITKGTTPTTLGYDYVDEGINFVKIESITDDGKFITEKFAHITSECNEKLSRSQLQENDLLFSIAGAIGRTAFVTEDILPANTNQALAIIRIPEGVINYFYLKYALQSADIAAQFEKRKQGVAQLNLSLKDIGNLEIQIPNPEEQESIVNRMDQINRLIAMRKEQLSKLDELVKARFVEMFENNVFPSEQLERNVIEMFIGPFGSSLKNEYFVDQQDGFCMVYEQKHAIQKTMDVPTRYITQGKYEELKRFVVLPGDIIVSCRGTIGESFLVPDDAPMGIMHPSIMKIRLNKGKYNPCFFLFALNQYMLEHNAEAKGSGVKMAVSATVLGQSAFVCPPMKVQQEFASFVEQTNKTKLTIQQSLDRLEVMKNALMQKYFG